MAKSTDRGFSLIEAAVAVAILAILAGAAVPLALNAMHQQREQKTREQLKGAFEALFGSRERRVSNMRADFGYNPGSLADLRAMVLQTSAGSPPNYASSSGIFWGWNGPYWSGSVDGNSSPVDGWGNPIRLTYAGGGWQLLSLGRNGALGGGDDLVYPSTAAPSTGCMATLMLSIKKVSGKNYTGQCTLSYPWQGALFQSPNAITGSTTQSITTLVNAGPVSIALDPTVANPTYFDPVLLPIDLLPGEVRAIEVSI